MLSIKNISLTIKGRTVIENFSLGINPGACIAITGPSGVGKSLLMNILIGELQPTKGTIGIDGIPLAKLQPSLMRLYHRNLGIMLQEHPLFSDHSLADNIALALEAREWPKGKMNARVAEVLAEVELTEKSPLSPALLTIGERRRAALAQAIVSSPKIIIADEPIPGGTDEQSADLILELLRREHDRGATLILFTHTPKSIASLDPTIISLEEREEDVITPQKRHHRVTVSVVP